MIEEPPLNDFNFVRALRVWRDNKTRIIFKKKS